jgi:hypothetical protein
MKWKNILIALVLAALLAGCGTVAPVFQADASAAANPWTHLAFRNNSDNFQFAIVADRFGGNRPGIFEDAVRKLNLLQPEFVLCVGDLIDGKIEDKAQVTNQWNEFDGIIKELQMPFFCLPGNHDISNAAMLDVWRSRLGRPYYHFTYRNVLFLCLDTEDPPSRQISAAQVDYFRQVLESNSQVRWTLVFMHQPVWQDNAGQGFSEIETMLADRPYTVFGGHDHTCEKALRNGRCYYKLATTGGASGLQTSAGQFDENVLGTMTDKGPVPVNFLLNGILGDDPRNAVK